MYLNTQLNSLSDCLVKLKRQHGASQTAKLSQDLRDEQKQHEEGLERKAADAIQSILEQIKTVELKTQQMEKELGGMGKKYEKLMDKTYLAHIEKTCESQNAQIKQFEKDNAKLEKRTK